MRKLIVTAVVIVFATSTPVFAAQSSLHAPNNVPWLADDSCFHDVNARFKALQMIPCWANSAIE